jgi:hypothetical protein
LHRYSSMERRDKILRPNDEAHAPSQLTISAEMNDLEAAKAFIISESARVCARAVGYKARAIVLTGSLSRGEATLKRDGLGWRALGDATLLVIHRRPSSLDTARIELEIERSLVSRGIKCKIVVIASTAAALSKMKPHIYAFELRERGIVVWGEQSILDLIPRFTAVEIPIEDGWWFLCNRIIEQLGTVAKAKELPDGESIRYRIAKLYLAMAAGYLLTIGRYEPSYRDRARRLREIAESGAPQLSPIPLQRFSRFVSACTYLKLHGHTNDGGDQFPQWHDATADAEALWRWMLVRILDVDPQSSRSELLAMIAERQSFVARARGWLRAAIVRPRVFCSSWSRWARLMRLGSPRYLVYGAASELFFHSGGTEAVKSDQLAKIAGNLPFNVRKDDRDLTWGKVASMIADNFHSFVESTRS